VSCKVKLPINKLLTNLPNTRPSRARAVPAMTHTHWPCSPSQHARCTMSSRHPYTRDSGHWWTVSISQGKFWLVQLVACTMCQTAVNAAAFLQIRRSFHTSRHVTSHTRTYRKIQLADHNGNVRFSAGSGKIHKKLALKFCLRLVSPWNWWMMMMMMMMDVAYGTVCQPSCESRTLHSDNFDEHSKRIYLVTDSCCAEWQCFSCAVYKCVYLLTYTHTRADTCINNTYLCRTVQLARTSMW